MYDTGAIKPDERVLLVLTGNGLKDADAARRVLKEPFRIRPDFDELARLIADLDKP
jgi:threonine synthase